MPCRSAGLACAAATVWASMWTQRAAGAPPTEWHPVGITGGGAFFAPSFHPTDSQVLMATTDMSAVFRSGDGGASWATLPYTDMGGGRPAQVRFTAGDTAYSIDCSGPSAAGPSGQYPAVSTDRGLTFTALNNTPAGAAARTLDTDRSGQHLVLSDPTRVYVSTDGGASWVGVVSAAAGLRVAGEPLFTQSGWVVVATDRGVAAVGPGPTHPTTFTPWGNASEGLAGFAAAEDPETPGKVTCFALTAPASVFGGGGPPIETIMGSSLRLYSAELDSPDAIPVWTQVPAMPLLVGEGGPLGATYVRMVPGDPDTAYLAGQCAGNCNFGHSTGGYPFVLQLRRSSEGDWATPANGAGNGNGDHHGRGRWVAQHILRGDNNTNTGWEGSWNDGVDGERWSWGGGALSFTVAPAVPQPTDHSDPIRPSHPTSVSTRPHRLAFTDDGFLHGSVDGGETWQALYVAPSQRNPLGVSVPVAQSWAGNGLMDQSSHYVGWANATAVFAGYTDIRGVVSKDGGQTWSYHYTGHTLNTMYRTVLVTSRGNPNSTRASNTTTLYAATSSEHDMYQSTHLTDKTIDTDGEGRVLGTQDGGTTWVTVADLEMPVLWVTADPLRPGRLYATGVHSTRGGVFLADGVDGLRPATFRKLPNPPRTQGHPYTVEALPDGGLVVSYSGRMDDPRTTFYNSSGVFYLPPTAPCLNISAPSSAACPWEDRSTNAMLYWTKEIVVDPLDPTGNTWFACVFTEFGKTRRFGEAFRGGLYRTTDRGATWSGRLDGVDHDGDDAGGQARIESVTVIPGPSGATADVYMTTEGAGLWHSGYDPTVSDGGLRFTAQPKYPFSHPTRVVQNPFNRTELWVTSFGNGLYKGMAVADR